MVEDERGEQGVGGGGGENDALMLSLAEVSRASGVPTAVLLRFSRERPGEVPKFGAGRAWYFPEGVVSVVRRLYRQEVGEERLEEVASEEGSRGLMSLARVRRERAEADRRDRERSEEASRQAEVEPDLAERVGRLAERSRWMAGQLAEVVAELRGATLRGVFREGDREGGGG